MDRPEVALSISQYLDRNTLASTTLVSKAWRRAFTPLLYKTINPDHPQPTREVIALHANHIHNLFFDINSKYQKPLGLDAFSPCSSLIDLAVCFNKTTSESTHMKTTSLVSQNQQTLTRLLLQDSGTTIERLGWRKLFATCGPNLRSLQLKTLQLRVQDLQKLWDQLGPTLVELELFWCQFDEVPFNAEPQFPNLEVLKMVEAFPSASQELEWVKQSPNLKALYWFKNDPNPEANKIFCRGLGNGYWPQLERLALRNEQQQLSDALIARVLDCCASLKTLDVSLSGFWIGSLSALERHFLSLEELHLINCRHVQSWMMAMVLRSCPNLMVLRGGELKAHEIVEGPASHTARLYQIEKDQVTNEIIRDQEIETNDMNDRHQHHKGSTTSGTKGSRGNKGGKDMDSYKVDLFMTGYNGLRVKNLETLRPWACQGLQVLQIVISLPNETESEWDKQVFEQISSLTKLRILDIRASESTYGPEQGIRGVRFDLDSGMGKLAGLKHLETVIFEGQYQKMTEADVRWILKHWPMLKEIHHKFHNEEKIHQNVEEKFKAKSNSDENIRQKLQDMFVARGINCKDI
ncbi:hypothetical protein BGZ83_005650 [Gryganskiella cystojenkinii]|nr:hypothetical protein BGZ83_005650 [Gryganskiella cystojenkinii]